MLAMKRLTMMMKTETNRDALAKKPARKPAMKLARKPAKTFARKPARKCARKFARGSAVKFAMKLARKLARRPARKPARKPAKKFARGHARKFARKFARKLARKPARPPVTLRCSMCNTHRVFRVSIERGDVTPNVRWWSSRHTTTLFNHSMCSLIALPLENSRAP